MIEIGGILMVLGGSALSGSVAAQILTPRSAIERARELLGDTSAALPGVPADMLEQLARLD